MINKFISFCKIILSYFLSKIYRKYKKYWIISERGADARDNGYIFYKYMVENHKEQKVSYVISKDSPDREKITNLGNPIKYNSLLHGIAYFSSKYLISSHPTFCKPSWDGLYFFEKKIFKVKGKKVFLQHGITKDYIENLTYRKLNADLFICGAKPEYDYILNEYGYPSDHVKYTGFSRFDVLYNECKNKKKNSKMILLMPTWRSNLNKLNDSDFIETDYYKRYTSFLKNKELSNYLQINKMKLIFYPHYEIQKRLHLFRDCFNSNITIADFAHYDVQRLLIDCDMLITDYSSVFFDVAYMHKNIIFYQFDYEQYRQGHYSEGYFDYKNSFGPVLENEEELLNNIKKMYNEKIDDKYNNNIEKYFLFNDNKNSKRIYDEILKIDR